MRHTFHIIGGRGEMGTWFKNLLETNGYLVTVSGSNDTEKNENIAKADCVIFAVPIKKAPAIIKTISPLINKNSLVVDLSSITTDCVSALKETRLSAIAIHCLFGPAIPAIANQKVVFIEIKNHPLIAELQKLFQDKQAHVISMTAKEHDVTSAYIQALIHFVNLELAEILAPHFPLKFSTPAFLSQYALITRVISGNSTELLAHIQLMNPYFRPLLKEFIEKQQYVLSLIEKQDEQKLEAHYKSIQKETMIEQKREDVQTQGQTMLNMSVTNESTVGYLGPEGTYSHEASERLFAKQLPKFVDFKTIYDIFKAVATQKVNLGVVPAENSTEGTVRETLDYLMEFPVYVNGSIVLPINHYLLGKEKDLLKIKKVIAHPQSFAQCREWLNKHLPSAILEPSTSNLAGIGEIDKENGIAIIASQLAAKQYNLGILAEEIQDNPNNMTKFYVISQNQSYTMKQKTLLFLSVLNRVGVLRDILTVFGDFGINLCKIESRPSKEKNWDYYFFIEIETSPIDPKTSRALDLLRQYCQSIKILGGI